MKKLTALLLALALALSMAACGNSAAEVPTDTQPVTQAPTQTEAPTETEASASREHFSIAALKGPTAMGLVKLMDNAEKGGETRNDYTFTLAGSADEVTPLLIKGELDMACVPANLASVLYNKTGGQIVTLGINTLGVIYIVENGEEIQSLADLKGKTIVASGKGSTPEYGLRYLLSQNGIDPDKDLTIEWKSEHSECVSAMASGTATIAMLPQPFVPVAKGKIEGLRTALDLTAEWDALDNGSGMITGVVVGNKAALEGKEAAVAAFLQDYAESVEWVNGNTDDAAALIGGYGIVDAAVAEKALPYCNIVCITGSEMESKLSGYLQALYDQDPKAVGGALPGEDFYY